MKTMLSWGAVLVLSVAGPASTAGALTAAPQPPAAERRSDIRPTSRPTERPQKREPLRLACRPTGGHAVGCKWSEARHPAFARYRLWRGDRTGRQIVFETGEHAMTAYRDVHVQPGATYAYVVESLDTDGRVIGTGGPVRVAVPSERPNKRPTPDPGSGRPGGDGQLRPARG